LCDRGSRFTDVSTVSALVMLALLGPHHEAISWNFSDSIRDTITIMALVILFIVIKADVISLGSSIYISPHNAEGEFTI
jgi:hypothetical protein